MKKSLRAALVGTTAATIGLAACDAAPPRDAAVAPPAASEGVPAGETLVDVVRNSLADIIRDKDAFSRARRLGALLPTLGPEMVPAVQKTLDDPMTDLDATELELLLRFWAGHQPEEASRWAQKEAPTNYREAAIFSALSVWAEADPQAAVKATWDWVADLGLEGVVPSALVRGWYARNEPAELRKFLRSLPPGIPGQRAISAYIRLMTQTEGVDAVRSWAESLPDDEDGFKLTVIRRAVFVLASMDDMQAAMSWCDDHCDGPYGKSLRSLIARGRVRRDGPATFAWLASAPEGFERDIAVRGAFVTWVQLEREAAMSWLASQTAGEPPAWLEPAFLVYAQVLAPERPAEAIQWAERIENAQEREQTLIQVARTWRGLDEAAAEQWLQGSPLSEAAREKARTLPQAKPNQPKQ